MTRWIAKKEKVLWRKHTLLFALLVATLLVVGCNPTSQNTNTSNTTQEKDAISKDASMKEEKKMDNKAVSKEEMTVNTPEDNNSKPSVEVTIEDTTGVTTESTTEKITKPSTTQINSYIDYNPALLEKALADNKKVVLFFHATWCPTCAAMEKNIQANMNTIWDDVVIIKVDYDTEEALKKQFNVTTQTTLVFLDSNGNEIKKSVSVTKLQKLLDTVNGL